MNRECEPAVKYPVSQPEIIGYYSVDGDRNYLDDSSKMSYYNPPKLGPVHMDLNQGIEFAVKYPDNLHQSSSMSHMLEWITRNNEKILASEPDKWIEPDFVCSTGILATVMCTPFKLNEDWVLRAAKWRGTIYLCRFKTQAQQDLHARIPQKYTSWGFKFEQYIVSDAPDKAPDTSKPVIEPAEFRCITKRRFGTHVILYSSEIDGVCSKTVLNDPIPLKHLKFVELKTKKMIEHEGQSRNFRRLDLVKWWAQSFVSGSENILCGFRDTSGIVHNLTNYSLEEIVEMSESYWDPQRCINYCQNFLSLVAKVVIDDCDKTIYKFEKELYGGVITTQEPSSSPHAFIPLSFLEKTG